MRGLRKLLKELSLALGTFIFCVLGMQTLALAQTTTTPELKAKVVVDDAQIPQGQDAIIKVTLTDDPAKRGLVSFQGSVSYDPNVITVLEVLFPTECPVWAANIQAGLVRFAATKCSGNKGDVKVGELFRLHIKAVGPPGSTTTLNPIFDIFDDFDFKFIPYEVDPGVIVITGGNANMPPVADFDYSPHTPTEKDTVKFIDQSHDPDGSIVKWNWDFGDGGTLGVQTASHKYAKAGSYNVTLTVTDMGGATNAVTKPVIVRSSGPMGFVCLNYPNPVRVSTTFVCGLPTGATQATLRIYNLTGRLVKSQDLDIQKPEYLWNLKDDQGNDLPNGPYFYLVQAVTPGGVQLTRVEVLIIER
jgi:hypothetical protein